MLGICGNELLARYQQAAERGQDLYAVRNLGHATGRGQLRIERNSGPVRRVVSDQYNETNPPPVHTAVLRLAEKYPQHHDHRRQVRKHLAQGVIARVTWPVVKGRGQQIIRVTDV